MDRKRKATGMEQWARKLCTLLSDDRGTWITAMLAEAEVIDNAAERKAWIRGIFATGFRLTVGDFLRGERPLSLTMAAIYLFGYSAFLLSHTLLQSISPGIHERWAVAWFPVLACFVVTLFPAAIGYGLWLADDLARKMTCLFVVLDLLVIAAFTHAYGLSDFRAFKSICDALVLASMFSSPVREACNWNRPVSVFSK